MERRYLDCAVVLGAIIRQNDVVRKALTEKLCRENRVERSDFAFLAERSETSEDSENN